MRCCAQFPRIDTASQKSDKNNSNTYPKISFNLYKLVLHCKMHGRFPINENKKYRLGLSVTGSVPNSNIYTRKNLLIMETSISDFHTSFYIAII